MEYTNFDLQIDRDSEGFKARVLNSGWGEAEHPFAPVFSPDDLGDFLADLGVASRDASLSKSRPRPKKVAEDIGSKLFKAVFSGDVQNVWRLSLQQAKQESRGLRLRLFIRDPEASGWPWEYLFDPQRRFFLALSAETPILRYQELPIPVRPLGVKPPLRILAVTAEPSCYPSLDVEEEWKDLEKALKHLDEKGVVSLERLEHATLDRLLCKLREPFHVLHFIGHGTFASAQDQGTLLFEDGPVTGDELATILRDHDSLRLVILNACEGAKGSRMDRFSGVAQRLVHGGVPAVIAMQFRVTDRAAIAFSRSFYEEIARGRPVDTALAGARKAMFCRRHDVEWGTPVLFSRSPDGHLFAPPKESAWHPLISKTVGTLLLLFMNETVRLEAPPSPGKSPPQSLLGFPRTLNTEGCPPSKLLGLEFVRIDPGQFFMGRKRTLGGTKRYEVRITQPYCMSTTEVTQEQWQKVMGYNPSDYKGSRLPVESVSPGEVDQFVSALNRMEPGASYSLPTEAQWQYGAQAGTGQRFPFGDDPDELPFYGNCKGGNDGFDSTAPVASFWPNRWGLHDMHGNVSEWVVDWYAEYPWEPRSDPRGPATGTRRVRRGGSWDIVAKNCDAVSRNSSEPESRLNDVGFRLVRTPEN